MKEEQLKRDFEKYLVSIPGINSGYVHQYTNSISNSLTPYIMEERQMNVAQVDVFSRLMMDRIIWLLGPTDPVPMTIIQAQLKYLDNVDKKLINLHIDTPGGSVRDGLKVIDIMNFIEAPVSTVNMGSAYSMGAVILAAGEKGKRGALRFSKTMIHQTSGGAVGNFQDATVSFEEWKKTNELLMELISEYTGKSIKQVYQESQRDKFFTSEEAKSFGIIDKIMGTPPVEKKTTKSAAKKTTRKG